MTLNHCFVILIPPKFFVRMYGFQSFCILLCLLNKTKFGMVLLFVTAGACDPVVAVSNPVWYGANNCATEVFLKKKKWLVYGETLLLDG